MDLSARFTVRHPGGFEVSAELQAPLDRPEVTVLFGPSGCGKTTVLRALAGLLRPSGGRIAAGGEVWFDAAARRFVPAEARHVGFVFQRPALFPHLDLAANVAFGLRDLPAEARRARVEELLALVGLEGAGGRRPRELSGGQQQRAALARALAPRPRLLLLDEPFASLDAEGQALLRGRLREALEATGTPAVLVTHDLAEARALGTRLVPMAEGRTGPPQAL